ncbi:hypothetical protein [Paenibacillus piscarius]|uniref:hypothetical protein n=1 Tax=Paenibacillus piscarius TaxID=1089681 RepID=UPI001EE8977C|nr:hypothetical protein [Paenibacillus piscarius]
MRHSRSVSILTFIVIALSIVASAVGLFSGSSADKEKSHPFYTSIRGEQVELYGSGIYKDDSLSAASQAIAQDGVTLAAGVPLLLVSLLLSLRGTIRGRLLLAGALGYFTYTYASYCFLAMYNELFLVYVMLFSASLFAFILVYRSLERDGVPMNPKLPAVSIGFILLLIAFLIIMLWLGRITGAWRQGIPPEGLEHYTTLVIQALDLAVLLPIMVLTGTMLIRRKSYGYLLAPVVLVKAATLLTSISSMIIGMLRAGVHVSIVEVILFPMFNVAVIWCLILVLRNAKEPGQPAGPLSIE